MKPLSPKNGFTLIELMIAMAIFSILVGAVVSIFYHLQSTSTSIDQRTNAAVNARGALSFIESTVRLAGFDPKQDMSGFSIMDSSTCSVSGNAFSFNQRSSADLTSLIFTSIRLSSGGDTNNDGFADVASGGATSLCIGTPPFKGAHVVANNIVAVRFAYAFDDDPSGPNAGAVNLSTNGNIIWAFANNADGDLGQSLDTNDDGLINLNDSVSPSTITTPAGMDRIRAVKVWVLARTNFPTRNNFDNTTYVVGGVRYTPNNNYGHVLLTTTIRLRNMSKL